MSSFGNGDSHNFLALYRYAAGHTGVPVALHDWAALSLIAAAVADRVTIDRLADDPLPPNLFVLLVAPSGAGKGVAIRTAQRLADASSINIYNGSITKAALYDRLAVRKRADADGHAHAKLWITVPELGDAVASGPPGEELLRWLTNVYDNPLSISHDTRTHGKRLVEGINLNWLAGTTRRWLKLSLPAWSIEGGFLARVMLCEAGYGDAVIDAEYPADRDVVLSYLRYRLERLATLTAPVIESPDAVAAYRRFRERWIASPPPDDSPIRPFYAREPAHVTKLETILALAEPDAGRHGRVIARAHHVTAAAELLRGMRPQLESLIRYASTDAKNEDGYVVLDEIQRLGVTTKGDLLARGPLRRLGITSERLREILQTLTEAKFVENVPSTTGRGMMIRARRRRMPKDLDLDPEPE